jgi:hypothetical protein
MREGMASASASTAKSARAPRKPAAGARSSRPRATKPKGTPARVRWDRLARVAMLCVVGALLYLYVSAGVSFFSTWREAKHDSRQVTALELQNRQLKAQHETLGSRTTLWREARTLGMAKPGEVTYIVQGLPNN